MVMSAVMAVPLPQNEVKSISGDPSKKTRHSTVCMYVKVHLLLRSSNNNYGNRRRPLGS